MRLGLGVCFSLFFFFWDDCAGIGGRKRWKVWDWGCVEE